MAALTDQERFEVWRDLMVSLKLGNVGTATKQDAATMVNALDVFLEANLTAVNNAIPSDVRAKFTTPQKALALSLVALKRALR